MLVVLQTLNSLCCLPRQNFFQEIISLQFKKVSLIRKRNYQLAEPGWVCVVQGRVYKAVNTHFWISLSLGSRFLPTVSGRNPSCPARPSPPPGCVWVRLGTSGHVWTRLCVPSLEPGPWASPSPLWFLLLWRSWTIPGSSPGALVFQLSCNTSFGQCFSVFRAFSQCLCVSRRLCRGCSVTVGPADTH